jgi:protein gp37
MSTKIEWTEETSNPFAGCSKISSGCDHCYAEIMAKRLSAMALKDDSSEFFTVDGRGKYAMIVGPNGKWNGKTIFDNTALEKIFQWSKPRMIFMVSMGDLFHEDNALNDIAMVFAAMYLNQRHTFQVLTKRPERAEYVLKNDEFWFSYHKYCNQLHDEYIKPLEQELYFYDEVREEWPLKNVWLGVTAENQEQAEKRMPVLFEIPAAKRFISIEPMLGAIQLPINYEIDWVICGGESGPGARPMHPDWVRSVRDQCLATGVPFFFKQWGEWGPEDQVSQKIYKSLLTMPIQNWPKHLLQDPYSERLFFKVGKKAAGSMLDGKKYNAYPSK